MVSSEVHEIASPGGSAGHGKWHWGLGGPWADSVTGNFRRGMGYMLGEREVDPAVLTHANTVPHSSSHIFGWCGSEGTHRPLGRLYRAPDNPTTTACTP